MRRAYIATVIALASWAGVIVGVVTGWALGLLCSWLALVSGWAIVECEMINQKRKAR